MSIRIATEADLPRLLAIYGPYVENTTVSFEYEVPTLDAFLTRFRKITEQFPWLVWEEDGTVLGYAYACAPFDRAAYQWCAEPSIYLMPEAQGKGIGKRLYEALEEILTAQGYRLSYAIITSENAGSRRFHERMGYTFLAEYPRCGYKFGRWLGVVWMEKRLDFVESISDFPADWMSIVENDRKLNDILAKIPLSE